MRNTIYEIRNTIYVLLASFLLLASGCAKPLPVVDIDLSARSAVIIDAGTGRVLYEKDPDEKFPPASTAKVMTAIVAIESKPLDGIIIPSEKVSRIEPTIAGLRPGVEYRLEDLLAAILIKSANDAAFAIAEAIAGDEKKFAVMMNEKAKEIGMENTYFASSSGLPTGKKDSQYTTARDLARMMRYAKRYDVILDKMSQKEARIYGSDKRRMYLRSHNKSLFRQDDAAWGKTGYTKEARRTFVGVDPSMKPKITFALLKSNSLWSDIEKLKSNGLMLREESRRTYLHDLIDWIKGERHKGREAVFLVISG
jgi:D-alanyl-D-alanine carboxypeptidase (penicillin-binding protein 5/6)